MVNINGENWRIYLVPSWHPALIRSNGTTTIGACDDQKKAIYILDGLSIKKFKIYKSQNQGLYTKIGKYYRHGVSGITLDELKGEYGNGKIGVPTYAVKTFE